MWVLVLGEGTCSIDIDLNCLFALNLPSGPVELLQENSIEIEQCTKRARKLKRVLRESMLKNLSVADVLVLAVVVVIVVVIFY